MYSIGDKAYQTDEHVVDHHAVRGLLHREQVIEKAKPNGDLIVVRKSIARRTRARNLSLKCFLTGRSGISEERKLWKPKEKSLQWSCEILVTKKPPPSTHFVTFRDRQFIQPT